MTTKVTFDKSKANRIAQAIADCADKRALVFTMRERLLAEFKGLPRKALNEVQSLLVKDALEANLKARKTISETSVGPMLSTASKIATFMPCMLGMEAAKFATVSESYATLAKFATAVKSADGDTDAALTSFRKQAKPNYKKSAAAHFKALYGMHEGKFFNAKQKNLILACASECGIDLVS